MTDFDEYLVAGEPDKRERAYGWATAIGLQAVDGLKVSDFLLNTAKRNIEGEITESEAQKIVDEYYENRNLDVDKTRLPLEEFFKVLLYGHELELKNRYLRIGHEYGSPKAKAVKNLHRHDVVINNGDVGINVGIKGGAVLSPTEENAVKAILRDERITAKALSLLLNVTQRQAERVIVSLKKKTNLRREGSRKKGRWVFGAV